MTTDKTNKRHFSLYSKISIILFLFILIFNLVSWLSTPFSDWYLSRLFPISANVIGRFSNLFPFAVGDILLFFFILGILTGFLMLIMSIFFAGRVRRITFRYCRIFGVVLLILLVELSLNWFVLYHTSDMREGMNEEYTAADFERLYNYISDKAIELNTQVLRDNNNRPKTDRDIQEEAEKLLRSMSEEYPLLGGYYPHYKEMGYSDIFTLIYISGYYFPVTMEANINSNMDILNYPVTVCHELAHLKGYIREDEASFLAIIACMRSEDPFFRYSGYLEALTLLELNLPEGNLKLNTVPDYIWKDYYFVEAGIMEKIRGASSISPDVVREIGTSVVDTSLKVNGIESGIDSYDEATYLLLDFFIKKG